MKRIFLLLPVLLPLCAAAQRVADALESEEMVAQVCEAAGELASLQCAFRQVKHLSLLETELVSEGRMYYKGGRQLRWEYTSPYSYTFVLNGDKVMLKSPGTTDVIDVRSSRMFSEIARIMMNSVTGRCLTDTESFGTEMRVAGSEWIAVLVPRRKEMAQMFSCVRLHIDPAQRMVTKVEMVESGGDTTEITMKDIRKNEPVDDAVFAVGAGQ